MKIISLKFSNITSFAGEQFIDFNAEPLKSTGLVAITGATGAGKTSLLDAICLALFNQIPRLSNTEDSKLKMADVSGEELVITAPANLLRRGAAFAYSEVDFVGQDGLHYQARWEIRRARRSTQGALQAIKRSLINVSENKLVSSTNKESSKAIIQALGLDFDQFTRAVLLPQSQVNAFLSAKESQRADLLEYLTHSEIFAEIGRCAYLQAKHAAQSVRDNEALVGNIQLLDDVERSDLEQQLADFQAQSTELSQQLKHIQQLIDWQKQRQLQQQQLDHSGQAVADAKQKLAALAPSIQKIDQLEKIAPVRHQLQDRAEKIKQRQQVLQQQQNTAQDFNAFKLQFESLKKQLAQAEAIRDSDRATQRKLKPQIDIAIGLDQARDDCVKGFQHQKKQIETIDDQLKNLDQQIKQQQQAEQQLQQQANNLQQQLDQDTLFAAFDQEPRAFEQQLKNLQQQVQDYLAEYKSDTASLIQQKNTLDAEIAQFEQSAASDEALIHQLDQMLEQIDQALNQLNEQFVVCNQTESILSQLIELTNELGNIQHQIEALTMQQKNEDGWLTEAKAHYLQCQDQRKQTEQVLLEQQLIHSQHVEQLRQQLSDNVPCMVCGSVSHPFADRQQISALKELQTKQRQQVLTAEQAALESLQQKQSAVAQTQQAIKHLQSQQTKEAEKQQRISNQLLALSQRQALMPDLTAWQLELQQQQQNFKLSLQDKSVEKQTMLKRRQQLNRLAQRKQQQHRLRQILQTDFLQSLAPQQQARFYVDAENTILDWQQQLQKRQKNIQLQQENSNKLTQLQQQMQPQLTKQEQLISQKKSHQQQMQTYTSEGLKIKQQVIDLTTQYANKAYDQASDWLQQLNQDMEKIQQDFELLSKQFATEQQKMQQRQIEQTTLETQQAQLTQEINTLDQVYDQWCQQYPDLVDQMNQLLGYTESDRRDLQQPVSTAKQHLTETEMLHSQRQQQLEQHLAQQSNIADLPLLNSQYQQSEQLQKDKQAQIQQAAVKLEIDLQQTKKFKQYQQQIIAAKQQHHRWQKIADLIGDATGAKFKKIAQQYHCDILIEYANQQLLSFAPRYTLQRIDHSLALAVIDHDMNDELRPVVSLSGGETFLVSLALALAIANMAAGQLRVESLFIDEGFGSLDQDALNIVMDALDRLQGLGRKIVLISHVAEMHERIPVKIEVQRVAAGTSQIVVNG